MDKIKARITSKYVLVIHLILVIIVLGVTAAAYNRYWSVAIVNGTSIPRLEYIKNMELMGGKQVLDQMIQETLISQEAAKKGVKIEKSVIDSEIGIIETQIKTQGGTLDEALASQGMSRVELENRIRMQKIVEQLSNPKTEIAQTDIDKFLSENKAQLPTGKSKEELNTLAKEELLTQAKDEAVTAWLDSLKTNAKIIYK